MGTLWGFQVTDAHLAPMRPAVRGAVGWEGGTSLQPSHIPDDLAISVAHLNEAGVVANRLYLEQIGLWRGDIIGMVESYHDDRGMAEAMLAATGFHMHNGPLPTGVRGASWETISMEVADTLRAHWPQVQQVASVLHRRGWISGDRVRVIMQEATVPLTSNQAQGQLRIRSSPLPASTQPPSESRVPRLLQSIRGITEEARAASVALRRESAQAPGHHTAAQDAALRPGRETQVSRHR